jgi:hypothetical protein
MGYGKKRKLASKKPILDLSLRSTNTAKILKKLREMDGDTFSDFFYCYFDFANIFLSQNEDRCFEIAEELIKWKLYPNEYNLPFYIKPVDTFFRQIDERIPDIICQKINNKATGIEINPIWPAGFGFDDWRLSRQDLGIEIRLVTK